MGADIHIYAERKLKDGTWAACHTYSAQDVSGFESIDLKPNAYHRVFYRVGGRNYGFFAALAGVRGPGLTPKGLPDDVSPLVGEEYDGWGGDAHSASWLSADEFVPIFVEHALNEVERAGLVAQQLEGRHDFNIVDRVLDRFLSVDSPYNNGVADRSWIRFVFWFDN